MSTNDSQQTPITPTNQAVGIPQEDEFDLGITSQESLAPQEQDSLPKTETLQSSQAESAGETFDFSLDLPENYAPTNKENTEDKIQSSSDMKQESREETPQEANFFTSESQEPSEKDLSFSEWELSSELLENPTEEKTSISEQSSVELLTEPTPFFSPSEENISEPTAVEVAETMVNNENSLGLQASDPVSNLQPETEPNPRNESSPIFAEEPTSWSETSSISHPTFSQVEPELPSEPVFEQTLEAPQEAIETSTSEPELPSSVLPSMQNQESEWPKLLNLDEMISHFSDGEHNASAQASMDPFSAMKATLEAQHQENPQQKQSQEDQTISNSLPQTEIQAIQETQVAQNQDLSSWTETLKGTSEMPVQTLNLDTMIASEQPISWEAQTPVIQQNSIPEGPLKNPALNYPQLTTPPKKTQGKGLTVFLAWILVLVIGGIAIMRYPDLLSFSQEDSPTPPVISDEQEHSSALEQTFLTGTKNDELLSGNQEQDIFESLEEITLEELPLDEGKEIPLIDLSSWKETISISSGNSSSPSLPEIQNPESGSMDPLGAVEGLVGPINNNDMIKQEILEYQQKGQELKEQGSAQEKRTMMKYGLAVEKEATDLLNTLANGENITISEWSALKLKLDNYLQTANNA